MAKTSKNYNNLCKQLPDLEEHLLQDKLRLIPIPEGIKKPLIPKWNSRGYPLDETLKDDKEKPIYVYPKRKGKTKKEIGCKGIRLHTGNYGILIGYGNSTNGYSIGCIDIDGLTIDTDNKEEQARIKRETQKYIYEALKDLPNTLQVQTQSGGYHIYYWTRKVNPSTQETSEGLYFPQDFPIKSLGGKPIGSKTIEIFTNQDRKQCVLPSSTILDEATDEIREYKVIGNINKFSDIAIVDDLNQTVINHLTSKGYTYKPQPKTPSNNTSKKVTRKNQSNSTNNLRKLKQTEINKVVKLVTPIFEILNSGGKHDGTRHLGGYFSYHITKKTTSKIADKIIKKIGTIFDSPSEFKRTLLVSYERDITNKTGLPKLTELILSFDKTFNISSFTDELQSICNPNFTKEKVGELSINDNKIPIYLYEDDKTKWLKYEGILSNTDLILNLNTLIGQFKNTKTEKEITSFNFKFENHFFNITQPVKSSINGMLKTVNLELPKLFTEIIRTSINNLDKHIITPKELSKEETLKRLFITRSKESYARKELGNYLHEHGTILRRGINKPYMENNYKGYDSVEIDDILEYLYSTGDFKLNTIHTDDIKVSLGFISERIKPSYNIVKLKNCLYDIKNFEVMETPENPILTLTEVQYNYNPEAQGKLVVEFLESSLKQQDDTPAILQDRVTAVYEFIGYLLTSGNPKNAWFIISGIGGAGKGVLTRLIISIFGTEKVGDLKLQELTPDNKFATSHLESKQINIVRDSPKKPIEDSGMLKAITGYDDIGIEHKGKDKYILPKEEVPDMVTVCNNIPRFKEGFDESLLQRAIIFEFLNKFRNTENQNEKLEEEILSNEEEMEFLIYKSIQAYKDMVENNRDFKARVTEDKTMELLGKHTDPITYILPKLVKYNVNAEEDGEDYIIASELNQLVVYLGKKEGVNITGLNKEGQIKSNVLIGAIRREFSFDKDYKTVSKGCVYNEKTNKMDYARVYPYLCKTPEYNEYLKEMEETQEE